MDGISLTEVLAAVAKGGPPAFIIAVFYGAAVLVREVAARNASGARLRIRAAGLPAVKTVADFDFDQQPTARAPIQQLATGAWLAEHRIIVLLEPLGTGKAHLATALGVAAAHQGHPIRFATATDWVSRLTEAHSRDGWQPNWPGCVATS